MTRNIAHIAVTVKDMDLSMKFYIDGLGFEKAFSLPHPETGAPWIEYLHIGSGQFIELFYDGTTDNRWTPDLIGFSHLCIGVDDIDAAVERIRNAGFKIDIEPKVGSDFNKQAWVTDPNGIRIELMWISPDSPQAKFM